VVAEALALAASVVAASAGGEGPAALAQPARATIEEALELARAWIRGGDAAEGAPMLLAHLLMALAGEARGAGRTGEAAGRYLEAGAAQRGRRRPDAGGGGRDAAPRPWPAPPASGPPTSSAPRGLRSLREPARAGGRPRPA
jgi:hypothetical protein